MNKEDYSKYLNHPLWHKKREEVFSKYGMKCSESECGSVKNLVIHHKTYSPDKMPWEYPVENFRVLCEKCHSNHHGFEYTPNKCKNKDCGKEISIKHDYCLSCHNKLIEKKEKEKKELENKIHDLEDSLKRENNKKSDHQGKTKQLEEEIKRLKKERKSLEKRLSELKIMDDEFKDEIRASTKRMESKISILLNAKENEKKELENRIAHLEDLVKRDDKNSSDRNEIQRLKEETARLEKEIARLVSEKNNVEEISPLPEQNIADQFKKEIMPDNKKAASIIRPIIIGLVGFAVLMLFVVTFYSPDNMLPGKKGQPQVSNESSVDVKKDETLPTNDTISNPRNAEQSNVGNPIEVPATPTKKDQALPKNDIINKDNSTASKNDSDKDKSSNKQSTYKIISIEEASSNIGNKIQIYEMISQVIYASNGNVYLNIRGRYPKQKLSLVIFNKNLKNFGDLNRYENKLLKIKGTLSIYKMKPEIIITHNWQIQEI